MILKLKPLFYEKVWGGHKLKDNFNYPCTNKTGEAWGISGHKSGSSVIENTKFKGKTLRELYASNRELFGNYQGDEFPILIKVIDAMDDLSIQVHPNDDYAKKVENSLGKTECWYILDCEKDSDIIVGHKANTIKEFKEYVDNNDFESVLNIFPIKKGDEFNIYSGTIHAIGKGTVLLEIQQSSDVTYRLYDYNRLADGKLRELHLDKALDVIKCPDKEKALNKPTDLFDYQILDNTVTTTHKSHQYGNYIFILEGSGTFNDVTVTKGDFLIVTANEAFTIEGNMSYFKAQIN
ncbi:MAG: class I mannose-6-phosphate isomerase [Tenericutes bacterium]|nr:class I mannose-6-phosphate isomerase [Mycoplasmatota bacterium]